MYIFLAALYSPLLFMVKESHSSIRTGQKRGPCKITRAALSNTKDEHHVRCCHVCRPQSGRKRRGLPLRASLRLPKRCASLINPGGCHSGPRRTWSGICRSDVPRCFSPNGESLDSFQVICRKGLPWLARSPEQIGVTPGDSFSRGTNHLMLHLEQRGIFVGAGKVSFL